ncbi:MAG: Tim44/TimA family putative adaptor protein [Hyphomicrobiaceae bacterium]|nr:Tim44/TimA family putative adaptor protein [Hyphomicrobiaceae bacterium]
MNGQIDIFTLLFIVMALIIILRLRSVLGKKSGEDDARVERYKAEQRARAAAAQAQEKVVTLPRRDRPEAPADKAVPGVAAAAVEEKVRTLASGNAALADGLLAVARADRSFDPDHFVAGARPAYEMIVTAFAEGNRKTLRNLLSREVFDGFAAAISERESRGDQIDQSFVGINKADLVEAELKGSLAHVTVRFVSELISATRDRGGVVIAGDPKRIKEVIDIWTFARDVSSRDPNWKLVATQAPA